MAHYLAIAQTHLDYYEPTVYSLHTGNIALERELLEFGSRSEMTARELLISGLLPTPPADVSLEEILSFREEHRPALDELMLAISQLVSPADEWAVIADVRVRVESAVRSLVRDRRYRLWASAAIATTVIATGVSAPHLAFDPEIVRQVPWIFSGLGVAVSSSIGSRMVRRPRSPGQYEPRSFRYLAEIRRELG